MEISNKILSDITVYMKYAKYLPELNRRESWEELVTRNKNMHIKKYPYLRSEIEDKYKLVYEKKVLPSMRSMQFGGKPIEISPNRIYNCAYMPIDHIDSFAECMFLLLGGTGVGYSVQKHHVAKLPVIQKPYPKRKRKKYPKCVPIAKARAMSKGQKASAVKFSKLFGYVLLSLAVIRCNVCSL